MNRQILITGCAGFIGMHVAKLLIERGDNVTGIDNLNDYYSPELKTQRLSQLRKTGEFKFYKGDISNQEFVKEIFHNIKPNIVVNLAAQPGVRYSITNPHTYVLSNLVGFTNLIECARQYSVEHFVYASSSSVYGANQSNTFSEIHSVDHPINLYAATKRSNELIAHAYSHLFKLPTTGLRYFTVYGPWGRPDMSTWIFTDAIIKGEEINVFNNGLMRRDFTFVDDIAKGTLLAIDKIPPMENNSLDSVVNPSSSNSPFKIYNLGGDNPVELMSFIRNIEKILGVEGKIKFHSMQPGDMLSTCADIQRATHDLGFTPLTSLDSGLRKWIEWYHSYC